MKTTLHVLISYLITALVIHCKGQSFVTFDGSQVFSNFKYIASDGKQDKDYSSVSSGAYSLGFRAYQKAPGGKAGKRFSALFVRFNLGMRKAGSSLTYEYGTVTWSLQYCDLRLGLGYEIDKWRIKPYFSVAPYYSFLLKGYQMEDGNTVDLKKNNAIKKNDAGILIVPGVKAFISDFISVYAEFSYLKGLQNIETSTKQKQYNTGSFITLGVAATLTKSKPKWIQGRR